MQPPSPTVLVGIPAHNEARTIGDVVASAHDYADEVLVVDDGSDDGTLKQATQAGASVTAHDDNRGYGAALGTIFRYAHVRGAEHLVVIDADGQHDVTDLPNLVKVQQETEAQIVTGSRFEEGKSSDMPAYRRFGLVVINLLVSLGLRVGYSYPSISDTQCGFRTYDREAITTLANASDIGSGMGASLDVLFKAAKEGYEIVEVPTKIDYDVSDASTRHPVVHGADLLLSLFLSIARDRPVRTGLVVALVALSGVMSVLALGLLHVDSVYVLAPAVAVVVLLMAVTLSNRSPRRSDRSKQ